MTHIVNQVSQIILDDARKGSTMVDADCSKHRGGASWSALSPVQVGSMRSFVVRFIGSLWMLAKRLRFSANKWEASDERLEFYKKTGGPLRVADCHSCHRF